MESRDNVGGFRVLERPRRTFRAGSRQISEANRDRVAERGATGDRQRRSRSPHGRAGAVRCPTQPSVEPLLTQPPKHPKLQENREGSRALRGGGASMWHARHRTALLFFSIILAGFALTERAYPQAFTANLTGVVTDPQNAV